MPAAKRARACDACHSIKIKCELGSSGGDPPCERCTRLGKKCIISPPIRQKDRVAELEAKIEALTKLLEAQDIQVPSEASTPISSRGVTESVPATPSSSSTSETSKKKRRRETSSRDDEEASNEQTPAFVLEEGRIELDAVIPRTVQEQILKRYQTQIQPRLSLASLMEKRDYEYLRSTHPILLQAVIYAASSGFVSTEVQEDISKIVIDLLTSTETKRSLELVQALQIAAFWYCIPRHHVPISMIHLIQLSSTISAELESTSTSTPKEPTPGKHINASDTWRTKVACYFYSSYLGLLRRMPFIFTWDNTHDEALIWLDYGVYGLDTDRLLCQLVRILRICEQISSVQNLPDTQSVTEISDPETQSNITTLSNMIADWKAQIPAFLTQSPLLKVWEHISYILIHESVLHTSTNKESFTAPYLAERLSVTNFPAPTPVTPEHTIALHIVKDNAQALLDLVLSLDIETIMGFSPFFIVPQACYVQMLLVKIYVATTARGNTYGLFLDPESLRLEGYLERLIELGDKVNKIDSRCGQARVLSSSVRVREWWVAYKNSVALQSAVVGNVFDEGLDFQGAGLATGMNGVNGMNATNEMFDWDAFAPFDESFDYGFGDMAAYTT